MTIPDAQIEYREFRHTKDPGVPDVRRWVVTYVFDTKEDATAFATRVSGLSGFAQPT